MGYQNQLFECATFHMFSPFFCAFFCQFTTFLFIYKHRGIFLSFILYHYYINFIYNGIFVFSRDGHMYINKKHLVRNLCANIFSE